MRKLRKQRGKAEAALAMTIAAIRIKLLFGVLGLALGCGLTLAWVSRHGAGAQVAPRSVPELAPWGRLECNRLLLERPDGMLPKHEATPLEVRWHFGGRTAEQTLEFLETAGLTASQCAALKMPGRLRSEVGVCIVMPPAEVVLDLKSAVRGTIYAELEKHPPNVPQQHPFTIQARDSDIWFARVGLSREKVEQLLKLTYRRGEALCFCDVELTQKFLAAEEFKALIRALYSAHTLQVQLRLQPDDPIRSLAAYWGRGGRTAIVEALLDSVSRVPGSSELSIAELLPPLPRAWLYSYPEADDPGREIADCFYSSLNFFRKTPEPRFLDPAYRAEVFRRDYTVVPSAQQLGDILVFADAQGMTQHACVHIADDIVFTKNGTQRTHPWVLMRLGEVRALYARDPGSYVTVFRLRNA